MSSNNPNNVLDILKCILSSDREFLKYSGNNDQNEEKILTNLAQNYNLTRNLFDVAKEFAELFNIYLYFIAPDQGKYRIIINNFSPMNNQPSGQTVVLCDDQLTSWFLPLSSDNSTSSRQYVFAFNDQLVAEAAEKYIEHLNCSGMFSFLERISCISFMIDSNSIQTNSFQPVVEGLMNGKK